MSTWRSWSEQITVNFLWSMIKELSSPDRLCSHILFHAQLFPLKLELQTPKVCLNLKYLDSFLIWVCTALLLFFHWIFLPVLLYFLMHPKILFHSNCEECTWAELRFPFPLWKDLSLRPHLVTTLFIIAPNWKHLKCLSIDECINICIIVCKKKRMNYWYI